MEKESRPLKNIQFCSSTRKAIILTTGIHLVFRGLKFEPDAVIGQKGVLCKGLESGRPNNGISHKYHLKRAINMFCLMAFIFALFFQPCPGFAENAKDKYLKADRCYKSLRNNPARQKYRQYWLECIKKFEEVYREEPSGPWAPAGLYMSGTLYYELYKRSKKAADKNEAVDCFERIIKRFSNSRYRPKALKAIDQIPGANTIKGLTESNGYHTKSKKETLANIYLKKPEPPKAQPEKKEIEPKPVHADKKEEVKESADGIKAIIAAGEERAKSSVEVASPAGGVAVTVSDLRYWSNPNYTRIVIDADGETGYSHRLLKQDPSLHKPQRLYVDLSNSRLGSDIKRAIPINDDLLSDVRAGQYEPGIVRVAVDIKSYKTYKIFSLKNPFRIVIDVWGIRDEEAKEEEPEDKDGKKGDKMSAGALAKQFALGVKKITVDMGHGGDDYGAPGYMKGVHEKDVVLILGKKLATKLRDELGCEIIMTRNSDKYLTLEERTAIANTKNSDIFISLHTNAARNKNAYGIETYYLNLATDDESILVAARENATSTKNISDLQSILNDLMQNAKINESSRLAGHVQDAIFQKLSANYDDVKNKGVKKAPFYVLLGAQMPAILIETSFISNKRECLRLLDPDYQELLCDAIINGVRNYIKEINPNALIGPPLKSKGG
jgi:N-acetylmuramoyl-L-alanine amidase